MMGSLEDEQWMREALVEARKGIGLTAPNPPVGAVIVKQGKKLAAGWHRKAGQNHAERDALAQLATLGPNIVAGSTIYITLEPCSTEGKTGSCTAALIEAGLARVVYATDDPNPHHIGRSKKLLESAGISVTTGILEDEAKHLIRGFSIVQTEKRPWVIAKTAMSLDGRITRRSEEGQWLTGEEAREQVQLLRAEVDCIITSGETVRIDNPALTIRSKAIPRAKQQPSRVVMTRSEMKYENYRIFSDKDREKTRVFKNYSPHQVLQKLASEGYTSVLLECGGELMGTFYNEGLIDEFMFFYAPMITGGPKTGLGAEGISDLGKRLSLKETSLHQIGSDLCLRGMVDREGPRPLQR